MNAAASSIPSPSTNTGYASEVRFGAVLYGGVSLAIYINGVTQEMYEMARATPKEGPHLGPASGTCEIYRRLAWLADNPTLRRKYCKSVNGRLKRHDGQMPDDVWSEGWLDHLQPARLVVDVISGTSAGGINGIFLAKALVNGEDFSQLKDLWEKEGDIKLLLNDKHSYDDLEPDRDKTKANAPPESLLNSDRMYLKLFRAMQSMGASSKNKVIGPKKTLVDELDLFVTTTDITGSRVPLRLSGQVVYERRHKQNFHFSYSEGINRNDFVSQKRDGSEHNAMLAFAARCTSSFPFAFEPMTMEAVKRLCPVEFDEIKDDWHKFLSYLPKPDHTSEPHNRRAFGDGGYLDNKPFSYVAKTLATREAIVPVERKLIYVEPAPEKVLPDESLHADQFKPPPDALSNSLAALTSIPRYETIREDLQDILKRNRSIERVDRIIREGEADLHQLLKEANPFVEILKKGMGQIPPWPQFKRKEMVRLYGPAFLAYRRVRVSAVTDELAYGLVKLWGLDIRSDYLYAMTALLRGWRILQYQEDPKDKKQLSINDFLDSFDIGYRTRKVSFLLRQIDHLIRLIRRPLIGPITIKEHDAFSNAEKRSIARLEEEDIRLLDPEPDLYCLKRANYALHTLKVQLNAIQAEWRLNERRRRQPSSFPEFIDERRREELCNVLSLILGEVESVKLADLLDRHFTFHLPEKTLNASACARTMQDSVLYRTEALLEFIHGKEKEESTKETRLFDALFRKSLDVMHLPKIDPGMYDILGEPTLEFVPGSNNKKVRIRVGNVGKVALNTPEAMSLRRILGEYYVYFDLFDQMSFPLYHDTGIGEPATVEVIRISPEDANNLIDETKDTRRKLAGTALGNFGAFLDRRWRLDDIMWGRLDGAERLIQTLLPMTDDETAVVRKELTERAHFAILRETLLRKETDKLRDLLFKALAEMPGEGYNVNRIRELLKQAYSDDPKQYEKLTTILASFLSEDVLMRYMRDTWEVDHTLDPKNTFDNASRAVTIIGRMLEEISRKRGKGSSTFRWITRVGLFFQRLIAVSLPGSLIAHWWPHAIFIVYFCEVLFLIFAWLFGNDGAQNFAWLMLGITALLHVVKLVIEDVIRSRSNWIKTAVTFGSLAILAMAGFGGWAWYDNYRPAIKHVETVKYWAAKCNLASFWRSGALQQADRR